MRDRLPNHPSQRSFPCRAGFARSLALLLVAGLLTVGAAVWTLKYLDADDTSNAAQPAEESAGDTSGYSGAGSGLPSLDEVFPNWPKNQTPTMTLVLSGQTYGYLQPCGCSRPQMGGLERRYNFMQLLRNAGWTVLPLDLGDITTPKPKKAGKQWLAKQVKRKHTVTMTCLEQMFYGAVGVGKDDFALPLIDGLANYTLQRGPQPPFVLAGNWLNRTDYLHENQKPWVGVWESFQAKDHPIVGVVGVVGGELSNQIQSKYPTERFGSNPEILRQALNQMDAQPSKPDIKVLLYNGSLEEARKAAEALPEFQIILCQTEESTPPAFPEMIGQGANTRWIINVGHKGRDLGVVSFFRKDGRLEPRYQLVSLGEEYETPPDAVNDHPVLQTLQQYAQRLKDENVLADYPKFTHPTQANFSDQNAHFVGSETCRRCHIGEYQVWKQSKHSHAYDALAKLATKPSLRQFDGECIICHTVGFNYKTGYVNEAQTPHLKHVGCESCHGPGSLHISDPSNSAYALAMSPWKVEKNDLMPSVDKLKKQEMLSPGEKRTLLRVDHACQKCHDPDNDPHFRLEDAKYWPTIVHTGLTKKR